MADGEITIDELDAEVKSLEVLFDIKRITDDDPEGTIEGYGSVYNVVDQGNDIIAPGAFNKSLRERGTASVKMLWQHDQRQPVGRWDEIKSDRNGLRVKGQLILEVPQAASAHALAKGGAIRGLSIGYIPVKYTIDEKTGTRTLTEVRLLEISLVTFPMNEQAELTGVKSGQVSIRSLEKALRDEAALSIKDAKAAISVVVKSLNLRDAEDGVKSDDPFDGDDVRDALKAANDDAATEVKAAQDSAMQSLQNALA